MSSARSRSDGQVGHAPRRSREPLPGPRLHVRGVQSSTPRQRQGRAQGTARTKATPSPASSAASAGHSRRSAPPGSRAPPGRYSLRSEEHTSELQSLMRKSYAVFCLKKQKEQHLNQNTHTTDQQKESLKH